MTTEPKPTPPTGWQRLMFRLPVWLYRWHLGWLLGHKFLLLTHIGRKSGAARQTVLEVVKYDAATDTYFVAAGFGPASDWYRNIQRTPEAAIQVGWRKLNVQAHFLSAAESGAAMVEYAQRNPRAAHVLCRLIGLQADGSEARYRQLGEHVIPFVALRTALNQRIHDR